MSDIPKRFVDKKIADSKNVDAALVEVIDVIARFKKKINKDISNMSANDISNSDRSEKVVEYAHYRLTDIMEFRSIKFKPSQNISGKSILMAIDLKHTSRGDHFAKF